MVHSLVLNKLNHFIFVTLLNKSKLFLSFLFATLFYGTVYHGLVFINFELYLCIQVSQVMIGDSGEVNGVSPLYELPHLSESQVCNETIR